MRRPTGAILIGAMLILAQYGCVSMVESKSDQDPAADLATEIQAAQNEVATVSAEFVRLQRDMNDLLTRMEEREAAKELQPFSARERKPRT